MKNALLVFFVSFLALSARASFDFAPRRSNPLLRFVAKHETLRDFALYTVMANRCSRYTTGDVKEGCLDAVDTLIEVLDYDVLVDKNHRPLKLNYLDPDSYVFVAFKSTLVELLNSPETTTYMKALNEKLSGFLTGTDHNPVNIWDFTVGHYQSEKKAARVIAALFQDTSRARLHLAYLERSATRGSDSFEGNKKALYGVIENINVILDYSEDNFRTLFYPKEVRENLNQTIYHFYVPLYLTMALQERGFSKKSAFLGPFMLNLTYEMITTTDDYTYLFSDPERITDQWKVKDIFGGYCGSVFAIHGPLASYADTARAFGVSSQNGVALLLR